MLGSVGFDHHCIRCKIGVGEEERSQEQPLYIDLLVEFDLSGCIEADDFSKTICYVKLAEMCQTVSSRKPYALLETLASDLLAMLLMTYPIHSAWIRVKKPLPRPYPQYAVVELKRSQHGVQA